MAAAVAGGCARQVDLQGFGWCLQLGCIESGCREPEAVCGVLGCALACMICAMHCQCCLVGEVVIVWLVVDGGVLGSSVLSDVRRLVPCTSIAHAQTVRSCGVDRFRMLSVGSVGAATSCCRGYQTGNTVGLCVQASGEHKLKVCIALPAVTGLSGWYMGG
jgi:hypothetical protein